MPKVVNAKLKDDDVIALNRKLQELGYDTVGQILRDFARDKVYLGRTKGIPNDIDFAKLAEFIVAKLKHELFPASDPQGITGSMTLYLLPHSLRGARCCTAG